MGGFPPDCVIPAKAGIYLQNDLGDAWVPAFSGMTVKKEVGGEEKSKAEERPKEHHFHIFA